MESIFFTQGHCDSQSRESGVTENSKYKDEELAYTVKEASKILKVSLSKAYDLAKRREIPAFKLDGSVRVHKELLHQMLYERARRETF